MHYHIAYLASKNIGRTKTLVFFISLMPAFVLVYQFYTQSLGINGLETLIRQSGKWALIFLLISLTITPARRIISRIMIKRKVMFGKRLSDWNWLIKLRRMLGLFCFFYACCHVLIYVWLFQDFDINEIVYDIQERRFILMGALAFLLLIPVAATSSNRMMRLLKKNWRRLHRSVYVIAVIVIIHFIWLTKVGVYKPYPYAAVLFVLLAYRLVSQYGVYLRKPEDDGMEVPVRVGPYPKNVDS